MLLTAWPVGPGSAVGIHISRADSKEGILLGGVEARVLDELYTLHVVGRAWLRTDCVHEQQVSMQCFRVGSLQAASVMQRCGMPPPR